MVLYNLPLLLFDCSLTVIFHLIPIFLYVLEWTITAYNNDELLETRNLTKKADIYRLL